MSGIELYPLPIEKAQLNEYRKDLKDEYRIVLGATYERLRAALDGQSVISAPGLKKGDIISSEYLAGLESADWFNIRMSEDSLNDMLEKADAQLDERRTEHEERFEIKRNKLQTGDDLAPGVLKIVKV